MNTMQLERIAPIGAPQYAAERVICDKAHAYAESVMREGKDKRQRNYLTAEESAHPDYAACNNEMRGRVEQYEILRDKPQTVVCYAKIFEGDRIAVTVWTGLPLGYGRAERAFRAGVAGTWWRSVSIMIGGTRYYGRWAFRDQDCITLHRAKR